MGKETEFLFSVPLGIQFWVSGEHEPITIALFLSVVCQRNWMGNLDNKSKLLGRW